MSPLNPFLSQIWIKLIYSEKATKFDEIFTLLLTGTTYIGQKNKSRLKILQNFATILEYMNSG